MGGRLVQRRAFDGMGESLSGPKPWPDILVPCNTTSVVFKYTKKIIKFQ